MLTADKQLTICYSVFCDYLAKEKYGGNIPETPPMKTGPFGQGISTRGPCRSDLHKPDSGPAGPAWPSKPEPFSIDRSRPAEELM